MLFALINHYCSLLIILASASDATPCITQPLSDTTIIEGRPLKLSCVITGLQVSVNWFHNGKVGEGFLVFHLHALSLSLVSSRYLQ
jgi:hypothetical protein